MFFIIIRFLISGLLLFALLLFINKSHITKKRIWILISIGISVVFVSILAIIPFENAFITFSSPQESYAYSHSGNVTLVVPGTTTDLVIGQQNDTNILSIIPKTNDGWQLSMDHNLRIVHQTIENGIVIYVYQYKNSNEHYISILNTNGGPCTITDTQNSDFYSLKKTNFASNETFYTYYAYLNNWNSQYKVVVNSKSITPIPST